MLGKTLFVLSFGWDISEGPVATVTPGSPIDLNLTLASGFEFSLEAQFEVAVKVAGIQDFASIDDVCIQSQRRSMKMNCDARGGTASFKSMVLPLVPGMVTDAIFFILTISSLDVQEDQLKQP